MTTAKKVFELQATLEEVWSVVTDLQHYAWRSDIREIKIVNEQTFMELSNDHIETTFHITKYEPYRCYAFDIENKNMQGHWKGMFEQTSTGVKLTFIEEVEVKHTIMKLFVKTFLKKQQDMYKRDLEMVFLQHS